MNNRFKVKGTIIDISTVKKGLNKKGTPFVSVDFLLRVDGDKENIIKFTSYSQKRVDNFIKFNDIGQYVMVSFSIYGNKHKDGYINNIVSYSVWSIKDTDNNDNFYFKE